MQHFVTDLGKELAGCFSDKLWCDTLPRVAQHEPAIWHGMVAVASLDLEMRKRSEAPPTDVAIMHYSRALQALQVRLEDHRSPPKDVVSLACVVFAMFEFKQDHHQSALRHISGGLKILTEWLRGGLRGNSSSGTYLDRAKLQGVFLCLDAQAIHFGVKDFREFFSGPALDDHVKLTDFSSFEDAHMFFNQIFHRASHWINWLDPVTALGTRPSDEWMASEKETLKTQLAAWDTAFDRLGATVTAPYHLLLATRKIIEIVFAWSDDPSDPLGWDKYLPEFKEALFHAEAFLSLTVESPKGDPGRPTLTVAMDIVMPLFLIATRCRDTVVRHKALKLLQTCNRTEGIWNAAQCAIVVEQIIKMEEAAALEHDGHVPAEARMICADVDCVADKAAIVEIRVRDEKDELHTMGLPLLLV
ncbi:uncharacterized protein AB675_3533 [Cyphellophora attinorum]|uniref:Uncharacterized protein n=1 Tax=Cyphellophora attinorum TaxID=1664694 RepID=A0A0N1P0Z3_9EURO|nr:uncharacterized protein AB675_3533 [Phialophora attinorum]KPI39796.1 hypothetical protein AB675_3533 [Phialophora attinorum]